jgi:hypothetical protein
MQLLTKPTDFEQSESLKLLLHGEFPSVAGNRFMPIHVFCRRILQDSLRGRAAMVGENCRFNPVLAAPFFGFFC